MLWSKGSACYNLSGEGNRSAAIALIGEAPGYYEAERGQNFVGKAGQLLDGCIEDAGLLRSELWIANSVRCRPLHKITLRDRKPSLDEVDACRGWLLDELAEIKPRVIVALGDTPSASLLSRKFGGIKNERGKATWVDELNAWVVQTFHPSYALRLYAQRHFIIEDLKLAAYIAEHGHPPIGEPTVIEVARSLKDVERFKNEIIASGKFHFDWETYGINGGNGVHAIKSRGFCASFCIRPRHAYVIPRLGQAASDYWGDKLPAVDDALTEIFLSDCEKGGFHVSFDVNATENTLGIRPTNVTFCGMIAHHALNNHLGQGAHGLKSCVALNTDMGRYDDELDKWLLANGHTRDGKADHDKIYLAPNEIVHKYNGMDSDGSFRLEGVFVPQLHEEKLWNIFTRDLMRVSLEHSITDRIGVRVNVPYLDQISTQLGQGLITLEHRIEELAGHPVNPQSAKQVAAFLFDERGLPILSRTDTGQPSTGEEVLKQLEDGDEIISLILQHRAFSKVKGTWIDGTKSEKGQKKALRLALDEDGYARMNTLVHGTETFRFVTRKPFAIHTFPKTVKGMPSVRALIIPDDGYKFLEVDYVQQEYVIQAIVAGQWDMVEACLDRGEDVHAMVMRDLFGKTKKEFLSTTGVGYQFDGALWIDQDAYNDYKGSRQIAKNTNFCIMFRGGAKKLARMALGCTGDPRQGAICKKSGELFCDCEREAAAYIADYYDRFDKIRWWQYHTIKKGYETGRSWSPFGTYRKLPAFFDTTDKFIRFEAERQACNAPIQIGGAHVMRRAYLGVTDRFRKEKFPGRIVVTVHDQLIAQVRADLIEEGSYIVRRYMEAPYPELGGRSLRTDCVETEQWGG